VVHPWLKTSRKPDLSDRHYEWLNRRIFATCCEDPCPQLLPLSWHPACNPKQAPLELARSSSDLPLPHRTPAATMTWTLPTLKTPIPRSTSPLLPPAPPPVPPACSAMLEGADTDTFMADFDDPEAFYASGAKDKVLADLQAATRSTHNLTETLNLWSHQGYRLDADAADSHSPLSYYRLFTQSLRSVSSNMLWLLDPRHNPLLSMPLLRASTPRPHQPLPPHHHPAPLDLGLCPAPPMPPLTLPASAAQSRRPYLCALASAPYPPTLNHSQQRHPPLLPSPSPLPPKGGRAPPLPRQGLSRWPSPSRLLPLLPSFTPNRSCPVLPSLPPLIWTGRRPVVNGPPPMAPLAKRSWSSLLRPPTGLISRWLDR
jgi:hypothetical protein